MQPLPIGFVSFSDWKLPPLASPRLLVSVYGNDFWKGFIPLSRMELQGWFL